MNSFWSGKLNAPVGQTLVQDEQPTTQFNGFATPGLSALPDGPLDPCRPRLCHLSLA